LKYESDNFTHRLVVDSVNFNDAGEYTFQAENQRTTAYLFVQRRFWAILDQKVNFAKNVEQLLLEPSSV